MTSQDFPREALDTNKSGTVVVRLTTDETGKVTNCVVVASSGMKSMDAVTCRAALKRAKYKPAFGADGRPNSGHVHQLCLISGHVLSESFV